MVVAYVRVSTGKQHLINQKEEISRYVLNQNLSIDRWIEETVSGKANHNTRRLGRIIHRLKSGDLLIVTEISRLSRSLHEIMVIMKYCVDNGVAVHSTKEGYVFDDSLNSKVLSFAFGLAAEIEHKLISQRTKEALAVRKAQGIHIGRSFGSDYKYKQAAAQKDEILAAISGNISLAEICRRMGFSRHILEKLRKNFPDIDNAIKERNTAMLHRKPRIS